jgi:hypothetical protein
VAAKIAVVAGGSERCAACEKQVYPVERVGIDTKVFHKACFKCAECGRQLTAGTYAAGGGKYYCKVRRHARACGWQAWGQRSSIGGTPTQPHFKQLFKAKGNYDEVRPHEGTAAVRTHAEDAGSVMLVGIWSANAQEQVAGQGRRRRRRRRRGAWLPPTPPGTHTMHTYTYIQAYRQAYRD